VGKPGPKRALFQLFWAPNGSSLWPDLSRNFVHSQFPEEKYIGIQLGFTNHIFNSVTIPRVQRVKLRGTKIFGKLWIKRFGENKLCKDI